MFFQCLKFVIGFGGRKKRGRNQCCMRDNVDRCSPVDIEANGALCLPIFDRNARATTTAWWSHSKHLAVGNWSPTNLQHSAKCKSKEILRRGGVNDFRCCSWGLFGCGSELARSWHAVLLHTGSIRRLCKHRNCKNEERNGKYSSHLESGWRRVDDLPAQRLVFPLWSRLLCRSLMLRDLWAWTTG